MRDRTQSRFASVLTVAAGAWLLLSPIWISMTGGALTNVFIVGGVIALAGLIQLFWENTLPSWVNGLAAIWLFVSAFAFDVSSAAVWSMTLTAIATFILAVWDGVEVNHVQQRHHMQT